MSMLPVINSPTIIEIIPPFNYFVFDPTFWPFTV